MESENWGFSIRAHSLNLLIHASYDRVFQTPALENLLLASSPQLNSLNPMVVRLPVRPGSANYYEFGITKAVSGELRIDANRSVVIFATIPMMTCCWIQASVSQLPLHEGRSSARNCA